MNNLQQQIYRNIPKNYRQWFHYSRTFELLIAGVEFYQDLAGLEFTVKWPFFTICVADQTETCDFERYYDAQKYIYQQGVRAHSVVMNFIGKELLPTFCKMHNAYCKKHNIAELQQHSVKFHDQMFDEYARLHDEISKEDQKPLKIWQLYYQLEQFLYSLPEFKSLSIYADQGVMFQRVDFDAGCYWTFQMDTEDLVRSFDKAQAHFFQNCWKNCQHDTQYQAAAQKILSYYQTAAAKRTCRLSFNLDEECALLLKYGHFSSSAIEIQYFKFYDIQRLAQSIFECRKQTDRDFDAVTRQLCQSAINIISDLLDAGTTKNGGKS